MKSTNTYWISFVGKKGNLGCCIVDAHSSESALEVTTLLGINPGGEAAIFEMPTDDPDVQEEILSKGKNRLIPIEELMSNGYKRIGDMSKKEGDKCMSKADVVCGCCNGSKHKLN